MKGHRPRALQATASSTMGALSGPAAGVLGAQQIADTVWPYLEELIEARPTVSR